MRYLIVLSLFVFVACTDFGVREKGNGNMVTETYDVSDFSSVKIGGAYEVTMIPSSSEKVVVDIDENLVEYLAVGTRGSTLEIYNEERIYSDRGIDVAIYYKELEDIQVSGACELKNEDIIETERLSIDMSGAGAIELDLSVDRLTLDISGAGAVKLHGEADRLRIRMSGAGGYSGYDLDTRIAKIEISGVGSADVMVSEELDAIISGLGGINYKGDPDMVNSDVSGLGVINRVD